MLIFSPKIRKVQKMDLWERYNLGSIKIFFFSSGGFSCFPLNVAYYQNYCLTGYYLLFSNIKAT